MKKSLILFFILCLSYQNYAQIFWLADMKQSQSIAEQSDKLILMDFWADWCGPCKIMDKELWNLAEMQKLSSSFVCLKVNVDYDKRTAMDYSTQAIPRLILISLSGETIWESTGYYNAESYLSILRSIPANVKGLNQVIGDLANNKNDARSNFLVAKEYQNLGRDIKNDRLKIAFLNCSAKYLSVAEKNNKEADLNDEIEIYSTLNDVYNSKFKKALKKIESLKSEPKDGQLSELRHYILAKCYFNLSDPTKYQQEKLLITSKDLIDRLDN